MTTLTVSDVYSLARSTGLEPAAAAIATAIAISESGLDAGARGDVGIQTATWGPSIGLWQIRSLKAESGRGTARDALRLTDPGFNAKSMFAISTGGTSWSAWSTYKNGAYKANLAAVSAAAGGTAAPAAGSDSSGSPSTGWQAKALAVGLKLALVGGGLTLVSLGFWRLVLPGAAKVAGSAAAAIA